MITAQFSLDCNECLESFWHEGSAKFDLSLYSTADVRRLAKAAGWKRTRTGDICKACIAEAAGSK
jgi:hypothetical protein